LISKYVAGREKDLRFAQAAARDALANRSALLERLTATDVEDAVRDHVRSLVERDHARSSSGIG
jgi:hypothetical protein